MAALRSPVRRSLSSTVNGHGTERCRSSVLLRTEDLEQHSQHCDDIPGETLPASLNGLSPFTRSGCTPRKADTMSETATATQDLASQYAAQVTSDLEHNLKEQERVNAEIVLLQKELAALQQNHTVLVSMQQALAVVPAPAEQPTAVPGSPAVPSPRDNATAPGKKAPKKSTGRPRRKTAAAPTADQATLVDLVRRHLAEQSEPRSAAEITTALGQAHPERTFKTTVVRTTLEGLVAKSQAQRTRQGRSVYYTSAQASEQESGPQADAQIS